MSSAVSMQVARLAQWCWIACSVPIGLPNWTRTLAYSTDQLQRPASGTHHLGAARDQRLLERRVQRSARLPQGTEHIVRFNRRVAQHHLELLVAKSCIERL